MQPKKSTLPGAPDALSAHNKTILDEVSAVDIVDTDIVGTIFVIPLEAALPDALRDFAMRTGSLYKRLAPLDGLEEGEDFGFIALSGLELSNLSNVWADFACPNKVMVLQDLPGVMYSTMFVVGYKQIGLPIISWNLVAAGLAARVIARQRVFDLNPALSPGRDAVIKKLRLTPGADSHPVDDSEDDDGIEFA